jgi:UDPglucose 6-dehydrogenase/UDP-N-acetyl-D-galactosamine dehydrogenase
MNDSPILNKDIVCVIGLGYVGLPLAEAFSRSGRVIGYDTDSAKIGKLKENNENKNLLFTSHPVDIRQADFIIIAVPTPITRDKKPDLSLVINAGRTVSQNMKKGSVVILESTVYPGVTEDILKPILEESGYKCGEDFKIAYSPERMNPGDEEHALDKITKVVSGMDKETTETVSQLYRRVAPSIFEAKDIKTAEAAKVIENIQRDLNIALMNELTLIFQRMDIDIRDVLAAASTKWNFYTYSPGLVGGHCIPVDPYYLVHKAQELGYSSQVILAGRAINDSMPRHVAEMTIKALNDLGKVIKGSRVLIAGLTYKENVADIRQSPVKDIIKGLEEYGVEITGYDPLLSNIETDFGIPAVYDLEDAKDIDCVIVTVAHSAFREIGLDGFRKIMSRNPLLIDIRGMFSKEEAQRKGFHYRIL